MMQTVAIVVSLAITAVAVVMTARAVKSMLAVIRQGQPAPGRTSNPGARTLTMVKETFLHTRMLQWTWVGILHWFAFAAFILLSTAVLAAFPQLIDPEWTWPIIGQWAPYEWGAELLGLLGTLAIIPLIIYRVTHRPDQLGRRSRFFGSTMWQAYFVEAMVLLESSAILFIRGAEHNLLQAEGGEHAEHATGLHFPVSQLFGNLYPTGEDSIGTLENIVFFIAMVKIVSAMAWLIVISSNLTMGVAWHRFTAWFNIWFKREDSGATALGAVKPLTSGGKPITLDDIDDLDEDSILGVGSIWDFSWKDILDFTTCTECGRCQSQCPAWNTEKPLSPKLMMMGLREHAYAVASGVEGAADKALVGAVDGQPAEGVGADDWFYNPEGGDFVLSADALWDCTNCGACVQQCPVDIEHVDHFVDMRRYQVLVESNFPAELNGLFKGLENKGNPWNMSPNARMDWAKDLPFEVKVVGDDIESLDEVEWLFWVGCAGAYEDRAKKTTRAVAELLDMAGVSFGVLGNGETCTGDSARRAGNEFVFQGLAQQNVETFKEYKVKKVVSTCAHCFNTLKNEYKDFGIELEVTHHTQLLNRLVREGKLTPVANGEGAHKRSITYHDPCFLGRHNQVYTPPRDLLQILPGAEYREMERSNERSFCCGAGGARMWMEEKVGERINLNRTDEAVGTGADQIAVGCPFCRVMLSDGLTKMQADGAAREEVEVLDVAQMLLASVKGEVATKLKPGEGAAAAAPAAKQSVATKAEPEAGDVTVTDQTVVATEDAGPAAKASGGSSMFDDPGSMFDEPAAPAAPAQPEAKSGGSLFDEGAGGSLFDTPAEPAAPAAPAAPAQPEAKQGGSLFDDGGSLFDTPAPAAPAATSEPAQPEPAQSEPVSEVPSGGSLFDIAAPAEPAAPAAPAEKPADKPAEAKATPAAEPKSEIPSGGSLFDIAAPEPAAATPAAAAEPAPAEPAAEPAPAAAPVSSGVASAPRTDVDINAVGSLFDIEAPEGAVVAAAAPAPVAEPVAEPEPVAQPEPVAEPEPAAVEPEPAAVEEAPEVAPVAEPAPKPASSGAAHQPRTDADIHGAESLFDL
ncbi:heterodisulfide reductase-related iron-sulfur binding cluster [Nocardioides sp. YIM 152588]|uniref:(Fe-S)-binding protein n=1 Tax=Nocardioides sp. YIM 152588 TaxID=3158259 RepID=UPI0032E48AEB